MRLLHTSDWHLGRSFHGHSTLPQLREVLAAIPRLVEEREIDVVLVAGDVFDHAAPAAELFGVLAEAIRGIREAGAELVMISGNHDNAARLGFQSEWAALGGVHVLTRPDAFRRPLVLRDEHGPVDVYGIPYLEPLLQRALFPGERLREHHELLARVMGEVDGLSAERGNRSVVLSHCFAVAARPGEGDPGAQEEDPAVAGADLVWDLTRGGLDLVPAELFGKHDYAALGHLHGRGVLAPNVRYSGAPLHFSFGEADRPRGAWLVELGAAGLAGVEWLPFPVPRPLSRLRGRIDDLLADESFTAAEPHWVEATLTDPVRPLDAMRRVRSRFPFCARIEFAPDGARPEARRSYASRVAERSDADVVDEFLRHVRSGEGLSEAERDLIEDVLVEAREQLSAGNAGGTI